MSKERYENLEKELSFVIFLCLLIYDVFLFEDLIGNKILVVLNVIVFNCKE